MAEPTDFDFDFDVTPPGSRRETADGESGNGDAKTPPPEKKRGSKNAASKAGRGKNGGGNGKPKPLARKRPKADSGGDGESPKKAKKDGKPKKPAKPKARPKMAVRNPRGRNKAESKKGEPEKPAAAPGSFDDFLQQVEDDDLGRVDPIEEQEREFAEAERDDFFQGEHQELFKGPAFRGPTGSGAKAPPAEEGEAADDDGQPKLVYPDDAGPAGDATTKPRPGTPRKLGGVQLPTAPDLASVGARLRQLRGPQVKGLQRGGNGKPPWGGSRIKLPFGLGDRPDKRKRGRVKKLRLLIIVTGLGLLAAVSFFFGIMMAVSKDLPDLENRQEYKASENSVVYDDTGQKLGTLTSNTNRILVESGDIAQSMKQAAVSIEDQRFYEHRGVDFQGIGRAVAADLIPGGSTQGASTITQQFVKNALEAQANRTPFEKLREAALAYHLERRWDKDKILTQYLNTVYFGEGAYGIEAAARTYFSYNHPNCGQDGYPRCASLLLPEESALLAGIISAPSAFDPRLNPNDSLARRNLVLDKMAQQGYLTDTDAERAKATALPSPSQIERPPEDSLSPYFTTWLRQQLVDKFGAGRAFGGGLRVKTTLDYDLQTSLESIVRNTLAAIQPTASIVVIDNKTGGIKAMVGGLDYKEHPFNIATNGHRQPGSAFKPFTLVTALANGHSPGETYTSAPVTLPVPHSGGNEHFTVHNYEDNYLGSASIVTATTYSDNSVYAQLGTHIVNSEQKSLDKIEHTAHEMGIQTNLSPHHPANPAMILGGLIEGVTPMEMAYAYSTLANDGEKVSGTLASYKGGPVSMLEIKDKNGKTVAQNKERDQRAIPESVAVEAKSILSSVISSGTGKRAQTGDSEWGKTGTTENNGDAWFCGATNGDNSVTACVWVGHPDSTESMDTDYAGQPVDGGTYPALIWAQVINAWDGIEASRAAGTDHPGTTSGGGYVPSSGVSSSSSSSSSSSGGGGGGNSSAPAPAPSGGGGGSSGGIGAGL